MNCCIVIERHDTENSIIEFLDPAQETVTVLFLFFHPDWILAHVDGPFFLQVGPFPEHMILSIISEAVPAHPSRLRHPAI